MLNESRSDPTSPLYGRAGAAWVSSGHSLGGGTSFLAADPTILAAAGGYAPPRAIFTLSAGTYTIPGAKASAPRVPNATPALLPVEKFCRGTPGDGCNNESAALRSF